MKRVMGTAGSLYCWNESLDTHLLDGRPMPPPSALAVALEVPVWRGCRRLGSGELVGYGAGASYDSRHLGPVQESQLWGTYELLVAYAGDRGAGGTAPCAHGAASTILRPTLTVTEAACPSRCRPPTPPTP